VAHSRIKVYVYLNLHKKCFSIKAMSGPMRGRVIGHADEVHLADVEFRVNEKGRQRVLRERKKYVHTGVVGYLSSPRNATVPVRYSPLETETFVLSDSNEPIHSAAYATLVNKRIFIEVRRAIAQQTP